MDERASFLQTIVRKLRLHYEHLSLCAGKSCMAAQLPSLGGLKTLLYRYITLQPICYCSFFLNYFYSKEFLVGAKGCSFTYTLDDGADFHEVRVSEKNLWPSQA